MRPLRHRLQPTRSRRTNVTAVAIHGRKDGTIIHVGSGSIDRPMASPVPAMSGRGTLRRR